MKSKDMIVGFSNDLFPSIVSMIERSKQKASIFLNAEISRLYWSIGKFIIENFRENNRSEYGAKIIATLSQQLTEKYGKGYSYSALTRMSKVAEVIAEQNIATLSQQLSWSHLIEISAIKSEIQRDFYALMCIQSKWGIRELRNQIDKMLFERSEIAQLSEKQIKSKLTEGKNEFNLYQLCFQYSPMNWTIFKLYRHYTGF